MAVVVEHVQAGAGGREQHRVARVRALRGGLHGLGQCGAVGQRHAHALQRGADLRRVAPDQHHGARMARHGRGQRREVLPLAVAAQDDHQAPVRAQAREGGHGSAYVGALAVVEILHLAHDADGLHAVRLATVFAQAVQHGRERAARGLRQGQRGQGVGSVVPAADAQRVGGHEALHVQFFLVRLGTLGGFVRVLRAHQPGHAFKHLDAEIARALRHVGAEGDVGAQLGLLQLHAHGRGQHVHDQRVLAVQDHQAGLAEDARLGLRVGLQAAVPVQVVLRDVEHGGCRRREAARTVELEAGQLQHPDLGQRARVDALAQRIEQRGADVARHGHAPARAFDEQAGERGDRGLAVGARDGQHGGRIAVARAQFAQRLGIQAQFALCAYLASAGSYHYRSNIRWRQARRAVHRMQRAAFDQGRVERPGKELRLRQLGTKLGELRRVLARVGHRHLRAAARAPARHRQARGAQAQDEHAAARHVVQRFAGADGGKRAFGRRLGRRAFRGFLLRLGGIVGGAHVREDARDELLGLRRGGHRGGRVVERGRRHGRRRRRRGRRFGSGHLGVREVVALVVHRSFNVVRPTRHSSMVTIQKRTTTCVSFQPLFSKWWCSGAIFSRRRPSP